MPIWKATALGIAVGIAAPSLAQSYDFESTALAGLVGTTDFSASTAGTLIGDWDADTNSGGTRTKPGFFGSFGATENVEVPVSLGFGLGGAINSRTASTFGLDANLGAGTVAMSNFTADFLADGPISLPASISLAFDSFRTRNPDSVYPGVPLDLPFGQLSLVALTATQVGGAAPGTLSPAGGGVNDLNLLIPVTIQASFEGLGGQMFDLGPLPVVLPVQGELAVSGQTASLTASAAIDLANMAQPGAALPQFPLGLPTALPPGDTANLLFDLMLDEIGASIDATLTLDATGTLVPAPSAAFALCSGLLFASPRRRRSQG